jgi:hypothetical protein
MNLMWLLLSLEVGKKLVVFPKLNLQLEIWEFALSELGYSIMAVGSKTCVMLSSRLTYSVGRSRCPSLSPSPSPSPCCCPSHLFLFLNLSRTNKVMLSGKITARLSEILNYVYHFAIFVPPLIILIVTESLNMTGYSPGYTNCFFDATVQAGIGDAGLYVWLIAIPFSFNHCLGIISLILTLGIVWKRGKSVREIRKEPREEKRRKEEGQEGKKRSTEGKKEEGRDRRKEEGRKKEEMRK